MCRAPTSLVVSDWKNKMKPVIILFVVLCLIDATLTKKRSKKNVKKLNFLFVNNNWRKKLVARCKISNKKYFLNILYSDWLGPKTRFILLKIGLKPFRWHQTILIPWYFLKHSSREIGKKWLRVLSRKGGNSPIV